MQLRMALRGMMYVLATCFLLSHLVTAAWGRFRKDGSVYAIKTIQTECGDMYDCVDFYKQPAFNHPLLKHHTFYPQMRPTSRPTRTIRSNSTFEVNDIPTDMKRLKNGGCPRGTVPIRRMNEHDDSQQRTTTPPIAGTIYAISQTKSDPSRTYYGVGATVSVYNPRALPPQYSSAEIIIRGGSDAIIAGWTVNPSKYNDTYTRFFIYSIAGDLHCFNSECGFIIVRSDIPLDFVMSPVSTRKGTIYVNNFFVYKDAMNGNWWLEVGTDPITLGFWPQNIFEGLKRSATYAACGGEINSIAALPPPEMGAGYYPDFAPDMVSDAFCRDFVVVNEAQKVVDAAYTEKYGTDLDYYGAYDFHMKDGQHIVTFGGP